MRFQQFKLLEDVRTLIQAENLSGLKDVIARRIKSLPDDEATIKALKDIEDLLSHVGAGGRLQSVKKEIGDVNDSAVSDARKVLSRLVLSIAEEVQATPEDRKNFFDAWKTDTIVNIDKLLSKQKVSFNVVFNGYGQNPLLTEFINEVMEISELGMGRGEFGLNVLSKSIEVPKGGGPSSDDDESGSKKGDLLMNLGKVKYKIELKTLLRGAARFGDQQVSPSVDYQQAAKAVNEFVIKNKTYPVTNLYPTGKIPGFGINLNNVIAFYQNYKPVEQAKFLSLVRNAVTEIFGGKGVDSNDKKRLKFSVDSIMNAIATGDAAGAKQAWAQASFNYYMSKKDDDGVLYCNLVNKEFVYYTDAAELLNIGLRLEAESFSVSATKDPNRAVYPKIKVVPTTFGGEAALKNLKSISKVKNPLADPEFNQKMIAWATSLAYRRGVTNQRIISGMSTNAIKMIQQKIPSDQIIVNLEKMYPQIAPKVKNQPQTSTEI
jgi:hypothetical protein